MFLSSLRGSILFIIVSLCPSLLFSLFALQVFRRILGGGILELNEIHKSKKQFKDNQNRKRRCHDRNDNSNNDNNHISNDNNNDINNNNDNSNDDDNYNNNNFDNNNNNNNNNSNNDNNNDSGHKNEIEIKTEKFKMEEDTSNDRLYFMLTIACSSNIGKLHSLLVNCIYF